MPFVTLLLPIRFADLDTLKSSGDSRGGRTTNVSADSMPMRRDHARALKVAAIVGDRERGVGARGKHSPVSVRALSHRLPERVQRRALCAAPCCEVQKESFSANWPIRPSRALVTWPKLPSVISPVTEPGSMNWAWLKTLKNSARNSRFILSLRSVFL